ncbi:MAG: gamma-glutamyl-gamma-aminobutyrate hydrolase family protein [bacterium]|nr:gamma-glutamyl-gamma-aminobutyrate hydrolase family protein [bacterium]
MKQIAIVSLHQNLSDYTNMLASLRCSFRIIRCMDGLSPLCDGLLLPGETDCCPLLYGQKKKGSRNVCLEEDLLQLCALERYRRAGRPVLGIDKGMHIINLSFGGNTRQHIGHYPHDAVRLKCSMPEDTAADALSPVRKTVGTNLLVFDRLHNTRLREGSMPEALYGTSLLVNSRHHQALDRIGSGLDVVQLAFDGCPEAVQHRTLPIIGVQWHPECLSPDGSLLFRLFLALV